MSALNKFSPKKLYKAYPAGCFKKYCPPSCPGVSKEEYPTFTYSIKALAKGGTTFFSYRVAAHSICVSYISLFNGSKSNTPYAYFIISSGIDSPSEVTTNTGSSNAFIKGLSLNTCASSTATTTAATSTKSVHLTSTISLSDMGFNKEQAFSE